MPQTVTPFGEKQAFLTASLRAVTASRGLSLADRACLALGKMKQAAVLTGDRKWKGIDVGVEVILIR